MDRVAEILASAAETTAALRQLADAEAFRRCWSAAAAEIGWMPTRTARSQMYMPPKPPAPAPKPGKSAAEKREARYQRNKYLAWLVGPERSSVGWRNKQSFPANIDPLDPVEAEG